MGYAKREDRYVSFGSRLPCEPAVVSARRERARLEALRQTSIRSLSPAADR